MKPLKFLVAFLFVATPWNIWGQVVSDYAVRVSVLVQTNSPRLTLVWPGDRAANSFDVYRKSSDDTEWGNRISLPAGATGYIDTNIPTGVAFEYQILKNATSYTGLGYVYAGIEVPLVESRGKVILLVENTHVSTLAMELNRLQLDLVGDGWSVVRHDVARTEAVTNIKARIVAEYNADPINTRAVFLLGHVPVPYSGDLYPDGHTPQHRGAWPADAFYGDVDGVWTDTSVNISVASDLRNRNIPGDGKFDDVMIPSAVELEVGRVDFANLPAFSLSEAELLRRYLNKDHGFRHKLFRIEERGLVDDELRLSTSEALAANGWRNFAPFFGASNTLAGNWLSALTAEGYLWAYGCGAGTFSGCSGVATTSQLATSDPRVVFAMLFGSYFGDWDSQDNLLRATLATTNYTLTSVWAGRPNWFFHHMGLGTTIGFSTRITQSQGGLLYSGGGHQRFVHTALMGDPTLRMHTIAPPSGLVVRTNGAGGVDLRWNPSPESVLGYHLYRAPNSKGPFVRMNSTIVTGTNYADASVAVSTYMVRAVKLEVNASGSYFNASQGIFEDFAPPASLPLLVVTAQNKSKLYGEPVPQLTVSYSGFVNGDTPEVLGAPAIVSTAATSNSPPGAYPIHVSGAEDTNYVVAFADGTLTILRAISTGLLMSSTNPSLPGRPVTFTMTVDGVTPGLWTLTGSVQFRIDGQNVGQPVILSDGAASYTISTLDGGWHSVEAEYSGDNNFRGIILSQSHLVNTPPEAVADIIERDPTNGVKVAIETLIANDTDLDGDSIYYLEADPGSANGGIVSSDDGWVTYIPMPGFLGSDAFSYSIIDAYGVSATGWVIVNVRGDNGPMPHLTITDLGNGSNAISGDGGRLRSYLLQFSDDLRFTNWQALGTIITDTNGNFQFIDGMAAPFRFYRSVYP